MGFVWSGWLFQDVMLQYIVLTSISCVLGDRTGCGWLNLSGQFRRCGFVLCTLPHRTRTAPPHRQLPAPPFLPPPLPSYFSYLPHHGSLDLPFGGEVASIRHCIWTRKEETDLLIREIWFMQKWFNSTSPSLIPFCVITLFLGTLFLLTIFNIKIQSTELFTGNKWETSITPTFTVKNNLIKMFFSRPKIPLYQEFISAKWCIYDLQICSALIYHCLCFVFFHLKFSACMWLSHGDLHIAHHHLFHFCVAN